MVTTIIARTVCVLLLLLASANSAFCWQIGAKEKVFPDRNPVYTGYPDQVPNRGYFLNYSHPAHDDYVYRSWWVAPRPEEGWFDGFHSGRGAKVAVGQEVAGNSGEELRLRVREMARQLMINSADDFADGPPVTVSTFVSLNRLYSTSSLGRYLSEQLISELQLAGVKIIEVRKTPSILISERRGEYGLSRDMEELQYVHGAKFMVAGTYTLANGQIFVNARVLKNSDSAVLSTASMVFGVTPLVREFLMDEGALVSMPENVVQVRAFPE